MPGRPFAVGGPSKNTNGGDSALLASVCSKSRSCSHCASSSSSSASAGRSGGSGSKADCVAPALVAVIVSQTLENASHQSGQLWLGAVRDGDDLLDGRRLET